MGSSFSCEFSLQLFDQCCTFDWNVSDTVSEGGRGVSYLLQIFSGPFDSVHSNENIM